MLRIFRRALPLGVLVAVFLQGAAISAPPTHDVVIVDGAFTPAISRVSLGETILWTNGDDLAHTATSDYFNPDGSWGIGWWDSSTLDPGDAFAWDFYAAGNYPYSCSFHFLMNGAVQVPMRARPREGPPGTSFRITVAAMAAPEGYVYDIQKKDPGGQFVDWMMGMTMRRAQFVTDVPGTYQFRGRLRRLDVGASMYSNPVRVTVTP
jgi:plastocyanin